MSNIPAIPGQPTVTRVDLIGSAEPGRLGKMDYVVTYQTPQGNILQVRVPQEGATEATVMAAVKADFAKHSPILGLQGKQIK